MKYGRTERISGIVILLALAAILVPWLMSDPAPRDERPQPSFTIEQPVDVPRHEVSAPEKPDSIDVDTDAVDAVKDTPSVDAPNPDPIADLMAEGDSSSAADNAGSGDDASANGIPEASPQGEWAVQVGSFGKAENAKRLQKELEAQGFSVYTRRRSGDLTTVMVGPFSRSEDGEKAMSQIKQRANQQGLLTRVKD
ncbi:MAG: SPOR domain-containing protein [Halomonas subglaciescola]|nr:SPOR domain-containing protein [Halomonas subglaciescola]